ncbi:MAG TPA: hypothetical protein VGA64_08025 [Candidatus Polarisedimenticolia bacterium]
MARFSPRRLPWSAGSRPVRPSLSNLGDPLTDIRALENVGFVMKGGRVVKSELTAPAVIKAGL